MYFNLSDAFYLHEAHFECSVAIYSHCTGWRSFGVTREAGSSGRNHGEQQHVNEVGGEEHRDVLGKLVKAVAKKKRGKITKNSVKEIRKKNFKRNSEFPKTNA